MIVCPKCQAENEPSGALGNFCMKCGGRLQAATNSPRETERARPTEESQPLTPPRERLLSPFWTHILSTCISILLLTIVARLFKSKDTDFRLLFFYGLAVVFALIAVFRTRPRIVSAASAGLVLAICLAVGVLIYDFERTIRELKAEDFRVAAIGASSLIFWFGVAAAVRGLFGRRSAEPRS